MNSTIAFDTSTMYPIGTQFQYRGKEKRLGTVIGYHVDFDTNTNVVKVSYRCEHVFAGQTITTTENDTTVSMGVSALAGVSHRVAVSDVVISA